MDYRAEYGPLTDVLTLTEGERDLCHKLGFTAIPTDQTDIYALDYGLVRPDLGKKLYYAETDKQYDLAERLGFGALIDDLLIACGERSHQWASLSAISSVSVPA